MKLKINYYNGHVNIDSDDFAYSLIANMYKTGHGNGLQLNNEDDRAKTEKMCYAISEAILKYHGVEKKEDSGIKAILDFYGFRKEILISKVQRYIDMPFYGGQYKNYWGDIGKPNIPSCTEEVKRITFEYSGEENGKHLYKYYGQNQEN